MPSPSKDPTTSFQLLLASRATEERQARPRGFSFRLRFGIRHIMWLSLWTALVLSVRSFLVEVLPSLVLVIFGLTLVAAVGSFLGLLGIALFVEPSRRQDRLIQQVSYVLLGAIVPYLISLLGGAFWYLIPRK